MTDQHTRANDFRASDMELSAYLDGELDKERMSAMDRKLVLNANLAARVEWLHHIDSLVRAAVPMEDNLPDGLLERLGLSEQAGPEVVDLSAARARRAQTQGRLSRWPVGAGLARAAAGLALVAGLGIASLVSLSDLPVDPVSREARANYATLSDASQPTSKIAPNAIVMFAQGTAAARARAIITSAGARIVSGPTAGGVWQLAITGGHESVVLSGLRAHAEVTLAEQLDGAQP